VSSHDDPLEGSARRLLAIESRLETTRAAARSTVDARPDDGRAVAQLRAVEEMLEQLQALAGELARQARRRPSDNPRRKRQGGNPRKR